MLVRKRRKAAARKGRLTAAAAARALLPAVIKQTVDSAVQPGNEIGKREHEHYRREHDDSERLDDFRRQGKHSLDKRSDRSHDGTERGGRTTRQVVSMARGLPRMEPLAYVSSHGSRW